MLKRINTFPNGTHLGTNISPTKALLKKFFLFDPFPQVWNILVPQGVGPEIPSRNLQPWKCQMITLGTTHPPPVLGGFSTLRSRNFWPPLQVAVPWAHRTIPSLKPTFSALKIGQNPKGKACLPTIHFQGRDVSFREGNFLHPGIQELKI